jgi:hypothetical protein
VTGRRLSIQMPTLLAASFLAVAICIDPDHDVPAYRHDAGNLQPVKVVRSAGGVAAGTSCATRSPSAEATNPFGCGNGGDLGSNGSGLVFPQIVQDQFIVVAVVFGPVAGA